METELTSSRASKEFKHAVHEFLSGEIPDRVKLEAYVPRVKVRRLLTQLLSHEPNLEIEHVVIRGFSGCSDFKGSIDVHTSTGTHVFDFVWDCRWRAESEGYIDYFGFPDQMRAAHEFDWQCFERWSRRDTN